MKKILLAAVLLTCGAWVEIPTANAQAADDPEAVVRGFYGWYLGEFKKDNWQPLKDRREALKYLTPSFQRRAPRLSGEMGADVIICAQDWDEKWTENFTVGRAQVRGAKATTVVRLPVADGAAVKIKVSLVKRGGEWRIDGTGCVN